MPMKSMYTSRFMARVRSARKNAAPFRTHQAGLFAPLRQGLFDAVFLAEVFLANVLDLDAVVGRQLLGVLPQSVPEGLGEAWIVENPDLVLVQVRSHPVGKADLGKRTEHQQAVEARENTRDLRGVAFRQQRQAHSGIIVEPVWFRLCRVRCWKERSGRRWATNPRQPTPRARCSWKLPANSTACRGMLVPSQRSSWPFCSPQRASH